MRYQELMREAIPQRPRNTKLYLTNRIRDLSQIQADLEQAAALVKANEVGETVLRSALRAGAEDTPDYETHPALHLLLDSGNVQRHYQIEDLRNNLESCLKFGWNFLQYVFSALERVRPVSDEYREAARLLKYGERGLRTYGFVPGDPSDEADPEYSAAKHLLTAARTIAAAVEQIERLQADVTSKLGAIQRMRMHDAMLRSPGTYHPEHGEVETLYHATIYAPEILRDGFSAERPESRKGVGSLGVQQTISFTHDLEIARNIMRSMKELWMIAHRQLTAPQILGWARAEGIEDKIRKSWGGEWGKDMPQGRDAAPADVARLYRYWQWHTKLRQNPVFISPEEVLAELAHRTLRDIGVLGCVVNLRPDDEYKVGEAEFVLPPDRVVSIKRVL